MTTSNDNVRDLVSKVMTSEITKMTYSDFMANYTRKDLSDAYTLVHDSVLDKDMNLIKPDSETNGEYLETALILFLLYNISSVRQGLMMSNIPKEVLNLVGDILGVLIGDNNIVVIPTGMAREVSKKYTSLVLEHSQLLKYYFSKCNFI